MPHQGRWAKAHAKARERILARRKSLTPERQRELAAERAGFADGFNDELGTDHRVGLVTDVITAIFSADPRERGRATARMARRIGKTTDVRKDDDGSLRVVQLDEDDDGR